MATALRMDSATSSSVRPSDSISMRAFPLKAYCPASTARLIRIRTSLIGAARRPVVEANDLGAIHLIEVADDGIADHFVQLFQTIRNSEDRLAESLCRIAPFWRFVYEEDDFVHCLPTNQIAPFQTSTVISVRRASICMSLSASNIIR